MSLVANKTPSVFVTCISPLTAHGADPSQIRAIVSNSSPRQLRSLDDYSLSHIDLSKLIVNRKNIKIMARRHLFGIVAIESAVRSVRASFLEIDPERFGLFVGAPPPSINDCEVYLESLSRCPSNNDNDLEGYLAEKFSETNPLSVLKGLPNNALCFGSAYADARGQNSNYICGDVSGHLAILSAVRAIKAGKVDVAIAGGYTPEKKEVLRAGHKIRDVSVEVDRPYQIGFEDLRHVASDGLIPAEGAAFIALASSSLGNQAQVQSHRLEILGGFITRGTSAFFSGQPSKCALIDCIKGAMAEASILSPEIGLVFVSACGIKSIDQNECDALADIFGSELPPVVAASSAIGHMMEASGIIEIGMIPELFAKGFVPKHLSWDLDGSRPLSDSCNVALIIRSSIYGDYSALVVRNWGQN